MENTAVELSRLLAMPWTQENANKIKTQHHITGMYLLLTDHTDDVLALSLFNIREQDGRKIFTILGLAVCPEIPVDPEREGKIFYLTEKGAYEKGCEEIFFLVPHHVERDYHEYDFRLYETKETVKVYTKDL